MPRTAFISHASEDADIARQICEYLENKGITCWIAPRDVTPGRDFGSEIIEGLLECAVLVLVMSESANASIYVKREVERAVSTGKPVFPIRVREVVPSRSLELFVASSHWIDAWKPPIHQYLGRLAQAISSAVSIENPLAMESQPPNVNAGRQRHLPRLSLLLGSVVLVLAAVGAGWWQMRSGTPDIGGSDAVRQSATSANDRATKLQDLPSSVLPPQPRGSKDQSTLESREPAPDAPRAKVSEKAQAAPIPNVAEQASNPQLKELLTLLDGTHGGARYRAIQRLSDEIPEELTIESLLTVIGDSPYRTNLLESLVNRLPDTLSTEDALLVLKPTSGGERYKTINILINHFPDRLSTADVLNIIGDGTYRVHLLKSLSSRLPAQLSADDALRILQPASGGERYQTLTIIAPRIESGLEAKRVLELVGDSAYSDRAISMLTH